MKLCLLGDAQSIHLQRISAGLARRGMQVHVVTHKPAEIDDVSAERFRVPPPGLTNMRRWSARRGNYLRGLLREFDVVHVHFLADWGFTPEMIREGTLAVTPWGSDITPPPGEGAPSDGLTAARRLLLTHASLITAWGPRFARAIADYSSVSYESIALVPLGVDTSLFRRDDTAMQSVGGSPIVGFFKGFRPVYGGSVFVRAMPRIVQAIADVRFCLIGDGAELPDCRELARRFNVDSRIQWVPRLAHDQLPSHLEKWQVSVIPSWQESFGLAALESSAMELPVVASNVGGLPDAVREGVTGKLVEPGDCDGLADAVAALLRDADLRRHMGIQGREMVKREFEWDQILDQWVGLYAELRAKRCVMV